MFQHSSRFTLVELLLVIMIVTLLAGLMLPVLRKSQAFANRASCMNNQRQLHLTTMLYADDFRGYMPEHPFISNLILAMGEGQVPYRCPSDPATSGSIWYQLSYGVNYAFVAPKTIPNYPHELPRKHEWTRHPSKCPLFAETKPWSTSGWTDPDGTASGTRNMVFGNPTNNYHCSSRHEGGSNYIAVAGNGGWLLQTRLNVVRGALLWIYSE